MDRCIIYLPDPLDGIFYLFLFIEKLVFVLHVLPAATTAGTEMPAECILSFFRIFMKPDSFPFQVRFFLPDKLNINHITRNNEGNKDHKVTDFCDRLPLRTGIEDYNVFKNFFCMLVVYNMVNL